MEYKVTWTIGAAVLSNYIDDKIDSETFKTLMTLDRKSNQVTISWGLTDVVNVFFNGLFDHRDSIETYIKILVNKED